MYKILVYVDAENVTFSTFKPYWDEAIALNGFYEIIGKFYGSKDLLGGTVKQYLSLGLEYCETSALSSECHKNLADITDVKRLAHLFMAFTQRFYGAALPMRQNYDLIRRWLNGSV